MVRAHGFEGMVILASCDKIIPGMILAAVRLNIPTIFLTAGTMLPCRLDDRTVVTSDLKEAPPSRPTRAVIDVVEVDKTTHAMDPKDVESWPLHAGVMRRILYDRLDN